jgi:hypothetical protein
MSINFSRFFLRGPKNSLRLANGVHFAYQGPWVAATSDTVVDSWYVSEFMAAEYTVVIDVTPVRKEIIKALVIAGPSTATVTVYGRTHLGENLIDLTATVTDSKVTLLANPSSSPDGSTYDNSSLLLGGKIIFSAVYYHSINELKRSV